MDEFVTLEALAGRAYVKVLIRSADGGSMQHENLPKQQSAREREREKVVLLLLVVVAAASRPAAAPAPAPASSYS